MLLTPKQNEIAKDNTRFRVCCCGRRFGKTILAIEEMIGVAIAGKGRKLAYVAPTFQAARDIAWDHLKARCSPIATDVNESQLKISIKTQEGGSSSIVLKSWDAIETLRGQKFHFLVLDEVAMYRNFWSGWQEVLRPTLTDTKGGAMFISSPKGFNHFYDLYNLQSTEPTFKSFHATTYDNPFIDPNEIEEARRALTEDRFYQEYMADFRKQEGLVYKEFNRKQHVTDQLPDEKSVVEYVAGVDFGYTNPAAVIHVKKDMRGMYWVVGEWYERGRTDAQIGDYVKSCNFNSVYADPENPGAIRELNLRGVNVREVNKNGGTGTSSVIAGVQKVRELMKQQRIKIHSSCHNLIAELEMYSYPDAKDGLALKEMPVKENDHALDALRYIIMSVQTSPADPIHSMRQVLERRRNLQNYAR